MEVQPVFKKLKPADAVAMSNIEKSCFSLPWSSEQCAGALRQKTFSAYGLWHKDQLLAYISFYHHLDEVEIINLAVIPEQRRKGFGGKILSILLQVAAKMGMQKVVLEVRETNAAAIALYKRHGFCQSGIRRRYYPDNGENALIYQKIF